MPGIDPSIFEHEIRTYPDAKPIWQKLRPINPLPRDGVFAEGNMAKISATIPINISVNPDVVENIYIVANCSPKKIAIYTTLFKELRDIFAWSYEEMPGIDPSIVQHEIWTYPDAKSVR